VGKTMFGFCLGLVLSEGRKQMNLKQTCLKQTCVWKGKSLFLSLFLGLALPGAWSPLWAQTAGFAYVANQGSNDVSAYTINATTGALTPVTGSPFAAGLNSASVTTTRGSCGEGDDAEGDGDERGDDGHKGSFRFHADRRRCQPSGEMDFEEPDTGEGMRGSADALTVSGSTAIISGPGTLLDGTPVYYTAVVLGNQPVIGANLFAISWVTSTGSLFHTSGVLTGGYIAVHPQ
jgi:hypothetical protein